MDFDEMLARSCNRGGETSRGFGVRLDAERLFGDDVAIYFELQQAITDVVG